MTHLSVYTARKYKQDPLLAIIAIAQNITNYPKKAE